jgi:TetR/AcrR family transcriptional repressor of nem operon
MSQETTKERALRIGESLLRKNGYNGFSFQDIADELGIRKPSLYDHFASKEALGNAVIENYATRFFSWAAEMKGQNPRTCLLQYFTLLYQFSKEGKFCPVSALSGQFGTLPESLRKNVLHLARAINQWITATVHEGQRTGEFRSDQSAEDLALALVSVALGGQLVARLRGQPGTLRKVSEELLKLIEK